MYASLITWICENLADVVRGELVLVRFLDHTIRSQVSQDSALKILSVLQFVGARLG